MTHESLLRVINKDNLEILGWKHDDFFLSRGDVIIQLKFIDGPYKYQLRYNEEDKLYIDHCHTNGHVRGLLCQKCNSALGLLQDDINILTNAINYLKKNG